MKLFRSTRQFWNKWWRHPFIKGVVMITMGFVLWKVIPWVQLKESVGRLNWGIVAIALGLLVLASGAEILSWGVWLERGGIKRWMHLSNVYVCGLFINQCIPTGVASDAWRWVKLSRHYTKKQVATSLLGARMVMFGALWIWILGLGYFVPKVFQIPAWGTLGGIVLGGLIILGLGGYGWKKIKEHKWMRYGIHKGGRFIEWESLKAKNKWGWSSLFALISWGLLLAGINLFAYGLGVHVGVGVIILGLSASLMMSWVPWTPGGLGWRDGAFVAILAHAGVQIGAAITLSLFVDFGLLPLIMLGGALLVHHNYKKTPKLSVNF